MVRFSAGCFLIRVRAAVAACSQLIEKILIGIAVVAALPAAYALAADLEVRAPPPVRV